MKLMMKIQDNIYLQENYNDVHQCEDQQLANKQ